MRDGEPGLFQKSADGTGEVERLAAIETNFSPSAGNWSPDGNRLVFDRMGDGFPETGVLTMDGERTWTLLFDMEGGMSAAPAISPQRTDDRSNCQLDPFVPHHGVFSYSGRAKMNRLLLALGRSSGVSSRKRP